VDSKSHHRLIQHCNALVITISTSTLNQDLEKTFLIAQNALKFELQEHIKSGGRISITTDAWSARNYKEFIAVTGHWISKEWKQKSQLLDIVHLHVSLLDLVLLYLVLIKHIGSYPLWRIPCRAIVERYK
jgi:hypothetical protein